MLQRKIKDKYIGGRVTQSVFDAVTAYHQAAGVTQGDLVREAVDEYMLNHPLKTPVTGKVGIVSMPELTTTTGE